MRSPFAFGDKELVQCVLTKHEGDLLKCHIEWRKQRTWQNINLNTIFLFLPLMVVNLMSPWQLAMCLSVSQPPSQQPGCLCVPLRCHLSFLYQDSQPELSLRHFSNPFSLCWGTIMRHGYVPSIWSIFLKLINYWPKRSGLYSPMAFNL